MALRFMEGFETTQHNTYSTRRYTTYSGIAFTTGGVTGRRHGTGLLSDFSVFETYPLVSSAQNTWIVQMALRKVDVGSFTGDTGPSVDIRLGAGLNQLTFKFVSAAAPDTQGIKLEVRRGATVLATSSRVFLPSSGPFGWWVFQFKATIDPTSGSYEVKAWDHTGTSFTIIAAATGVNTANQGVAGGDRVQFAAGSNSNINVAIDDIVIMDGSGSTNNDFTSTPVIVYGELPNADVAGELDWTPSTGTTHSTLVDDTAVLPAQTDEVSTDVTGSVDLYGFAQTELDLIPTSGTPAVLGILVDMEGAMKNSGTRTVRVQVKDGVNQATDTTDMTYSTTAKISRFAVLEQNPTGTPAAWTVATLKTVELGPNLVS